MPQKDKVIVQWYITHHPNKDRNSPFINFFPWKNLEFFLQKNDNSQNLIIDKTILNNHLSRYIQDYDFNKTYGESQQGAEFLDSTWQEFPGTDIKYIGDDEPKRGNINVFPLRFSGDHRECWTDPKKWALLTLPDIVIKFLQTYPWIVLLIHNINESHNVTSNNESFIYSLGLQKNIRNIDNPVFWVSASTNPKESYIRPNYIPLPRWFYLGGSYQWLEKPFYKMRSNDWKHFNSLNLSPPEMKNDVRFLCYAGRWRINRMYIASKLLKSLPSERIWISISRNKKELNVREFFSAVKKINRIDKIPYNLTTDQENEIISSCTELHSQLPISTFPDEEKDEYHNNGKFDRTAPNINHYKNIFVDIVLETFNERQGINPYIVFITEKTAKPILACRPFIISANAGFYKELHKLGFKTFSDWWDENFDDDVDFLTANDRLLNTVNEINSWSRKKCLRIFEDMKPTLLHNYKILNDIIYNRPRSWLVSVREMHKEWAIKNPNDLFY